MDSLVKSGKALRRFLKLSPFHLVVNEIKRRGINPKTLNCLEVFGSDGQNHTKDIASYITDLEIWEIRPECEPILTREFPKAKIKITDSYSEIKRTTNKFGLVVVDNSAMAYNHCEHFDLFPHIFQVLKNPALLVINIIPQISSHDSERLLRRQEFYNTNNPTNIPILEIERAYYRLAKDSGWKIEWTLYKRRRTYSRRSDPVYYAAMYLKKMI